ncbi:hypothetical protein [Nostoc sp. NMS8]|uniref:hypothetical protein n=1 Tax=Nostoc sp. NMS8 TaxID=2815392 RepID=UPI0025FF618E|nr:hypothetical protein [Nostoc sp. NMS8]MBN3958421.1 hypothetical protein [Nostoc sp. NMS8]
MSDLHQEPLIPKTTIEGNQFNISENTNFFSHLKSRNRPCTPCKVERNGKIFVELHYVENGSCTDERCPPDTTPTPNIPPAEIL